MNVIEEFVAGLGIDAYVVGGAVRDELLGRTAKDADFLVLAVDTAMLRERLQPHGRVEELTVAGRPVGLRLYPADKRIRALVPSGIEFAPPRRERSTGPGRHDFEIVVDPNATVEDDLGRRDFTVNAIARRLADGTIVDPHNGREDIERRILRTVSETSFAEDPLRIVRGLRLLSQFGFEPDASTLRQMHAEAESVALVSGERIGGGLAADGHGELSKLLLGTHPAAALRLARDTGVLGVIIPELKPMFGFDQQNPHHAYTVDEHTFVVVQATADAGAPLAVRLAALFHDSGKPAAAWLGRDGFLHFYRQPGTDGQGHEAIRAELAGKALRRLRYPNSLRDEVVALVRSHMFHVGSVEPVAARRLLARHEERLFSLLDLREADTVGKGLPDEIAQQAFERVRALRALAEVEREQPHRLTDLAVDGNDLIALGYAPGPALGEVLGTLLAAVVEHPALNTRVDLLARAEQELRG